MLKYSNNMVFFVIQGRNFEDIYSMTKARLQKSLCQKELSYIPHSTYEDNKQNEVKKTNTMLSSSMSTQISEKFNCTSKKKKPSSEKCLTSSSSKNNESLALRENFIRCDQRSSTKKTVENAGNSSNLQKAKRQISF